MHKRSRAREHSCFGVVLGPAVGEELIELADGGGGEAADQVVEVGEGFDAAVAVTVVLAGFVIAGNAAADVIFQAVLFHYATGQTLPDRVDRNQLDLAFRSR